MLNPVRRWDLWSHAAVQLSRIWRDLPGQCALCRLWGQGRWCAHCKALAGVGMTPRCLTCGLVLPNCAAIAQSDTALRCGRCLTHPPPLDLCVAALDYTFPWDRWLQGLKFHGQLEVAPLLAELLGEAVAGARAESPALATPDLWLPVPLSAQRLRERGFNQSLEIARHLPGRRQYRLCARTLIRVRHTGRQSDLPLADRQRNLHAAFAVVRPVQGRHVVVVDDVMTSGATVFEAAATLRRAGAASVQAWVVARTP